MKSDYNKEFDSQIKKRLEEFEAEVPTNLWAKIEQGLDEARNEQPVLNITKPRKTFSIKPYLSIAAASLIIGFSIWKLQPDEKVFLKGAGNATNEETSAYVAPNPDSQQAKATPEKKVQPDPRTIETASLADVSEPVDKAQIVFAVREKTPRVKYVNSEDVIALEDEDYQSSSALTESNSLNADPLESFVEEEELAFNSSVDNNVVETPFEDSSSAISQEHLSESNQKERPKIVSSVLNFIASNLQIGGDRVVEFSQTEDGILKADLRGVFSRNNR